MINMISSLIKKNLKLQRNDIKHIFFDFFSKNTIRIANSLDPDETPRSVASHLDQNSLQRPSKFGSST